MFDLKIVFAAVIAGALAVPAVGHAEGKEIIWQCEIDKGDNRTWLSEQVIIAHVPGAKTAVVADNVALVFLGHPVEAKVKTRAKKDVFYWRVSGVRDSNKRPVSRMEYIGYLTRDTGQFAISARPGQSQFWNSKGSCKPLKEEKRWRKILQMKKK
ncbi:hypothetical protein NNA36_18135 [Shimia sp. CNT1-13L.2]|uniref:hypothetical protein n=1 Tax=Shimia sp. CNT1-13L.2 TaxID=2959663 RepID=UPI0020CBE5D5|nr:hypothetical protein [Shimia sp. CNT1-13L.2]MCP9483887.1 hypothetical protein [Shimia sp. CNT1-13L.2]